MGTYTIGQVAERTGFPASTLRFYEDHGLLGPAGRTDAGYRIYDDTSIARLGFIDRAKQLGCTLEEITGLAGLWEADDCAPVQARLHELVTAKIADAQRRSAELLAFTAQLQTAAAHLGGAPVDGPCSDHCACLTDRPGADTVPVVLGEGNEPAIACTLPADQMPGRVADWQHLLDHVLSRDVIDGGLRLTLADTAPLDELAQLAVAEQGCCAFFSFAITVDHRGIALEVRAPADAGDLVTTVFGVAS
jgi:DNA-binding transcriptional MerR regulator